VAARRFNMLLLGVFANVALVLALTGVYGVQAYSVARRTSEIGVRVALGASRRHVLWTVLRGGMTPALLGIGLGLVGAFGLSRVMSGLLFAVAPGDPATYVGVTLALATAALVSCLLPGLTALRVDPATTLRDE
jgi:putative ABC transport system permease protein